MVYKLKVVLGSSRGFVARKQRRHRRPVPAQSEQHLRLSLIGKFIQIYNIYNFNSLDSLQVYAAWADWYKHDLFVLFVCFVALRPKSTAMVIAGRSVHLTTLFPGQA